MKTSLRSVEVRSYMSEVRPEIATESAAYGELIAWADSRPQVWRAVMGKSAAFGRNGSHYIAAARGDSPRAVLERVEVFKRLLGERSFFGWQARFLLEHAADKDLRTGYLQEHCRYSDGKLYDRHSASADYTPKTLETVIDRFVAWADSGPCRYDGREEVRLDGKTIRRFDPPQPLGIGGT